MCFMSFLTSQGDIMSFYRALSDCLCVSPRTPTMTEIRELTFHPTFLHVSMRGSYFYLFASMAVYEDLSCQ